MSKMRLGLVCAVVLVLVFTISMMTGCKKADLVVTPPGIEQTNNDGSGGPEPIKSNPVETYVEPGEAP